MNDAPLSPEDKTALAMVEAGYALSDPSDEARCLIFRVAFDTWEGAYAGLRAIGDYNDFNGEAVAQALSNVLDGAPSLRVEVGREFSPVVYVGPFYPSNAERMQRIKDALRDVNAGEIDTTGEERLIRAWWD